MPTPFLSDIYQVSTTVVNLGKKMFILAIDQGTTGSTALIIDKNGHVKGTGSFDHPQHYPKPGWVEHNPEEIKNSVKNACLEALKFAQISPKDLAAIGITNQRETTCLFDHEGQSFLPFIVWQCKRSTEICQEISKKGF